MRIKHFFGLAVIAAMTASCSSNNDLVNGGNGNGEITNETTVGYAAFNINLPSVSGTRADDPEFNKGDAKEYDVNNATLLIFKAATGETDENNYTFVEAVNLGSMEPWTPVNNGITTEAKVVAKLEQIKTGEQLYALVILNNKDKDGNNKVTLPTAPTTSAAGQKYSDWNEAAASVDEDKFQDNAKGFYMANAPLYKDGKVTTLAKIDLNKVYLTEAKAAASVGNDVYVERGVAKVTLATGTGAKKTVADNTTYAKDEVTISSWGLDVTNKKTYAVHKADGTGYDNIWTNTNETKSDVNQATTLRFVDQSACPVKRVYWGVDPNYSTNLLFDDSEAGKTARTENFNFITKDNGLKEDLTSPQYCLENTFNLANMMQGQTTRVVFKGKYTPKSITLDADGNFYKIGKNVALWNTSDLKKHIEAAVTKVVADASAAGASTTITLNGSGNDLTTAGNRMLTASNITVTKATGDVVALKPEDVKAINDKLGLSEGYGISTYEKGESYYIARVKHFGDVLTPWNATNERYGTDNLSFLGRYGMLRNNWYELTVNSVSGPGYPDVPEVKPNTPDDDDEYISVSVKVLDWAKRSQSVDL